MCVTGASIISSLRVTVGPHNILIHYGKFSWKSSVLVLTHWGRATHICVSKLIIIASDNGLSPGRRQAIIWNNAGILSIGLFGTNFSEILIEILTISFKKMRLKVSSAKWRPFCLDLKVKVKDFLLQQNNHHTKNDTETETNLDLFVSEILAILYFTKTSFWWQQR